MLGADRVKNALFAFLKLLPQFGVIMSAAGRLLTRVEFFMNQRWYDMTVGPLALQFNLDPIVAGCVTSEGKENSLSAIFASIAVQLDAASRIA